MFDWQTVVVTLAVAAAAGWMAWQIRRGWRVPTDAGCGSGCGACAHASRLEDAPPAPAFVPLEDVLRTVESRSP